MAGTCGICGEQSGPKTSFSPNTLGFPCQYYFTQWMCYLCFVHSEDELLRSRKIKGK